MRVSVVIPTYNCAAFVVEAVESALRQTRPVDEIIVVDDGSTDDTAARLTPFHGRIQYLRQPNQGVAAARNAGLRASTGDIVGFLDADDVWHPEKIARQLEVLQHRPDIGLLATQLTPWPGEFSSIAALSMHSITDLPLDRLLVANSLATSSIVVRRTLLEQAGSFDTQLHGPEDYDLWIRCARISRIATLDQSLTGYRDASGSLSKQLSTMSRGIARIEAKLDEAGLWQGRGWLRRKRQAHSDYTAGWSLHASGESGSAVKCLCRSLLTYPLPMRPPEVCCHAARVRLLMRAAWSCVRHTLGAKPMSLTKPSQ